MYHNIFIELKLDQLKSYGFVKAFIDLFMSN